MLFWSIGFRVSCVNKKRSQESSVASVVHSMDCNRHPAANWVMSAVENFIFVWRIAQFILLLLCKFRKRERCIPCCDWSFSFRLWARNRSTANFTANTASHFSMLNVLICQTENHCCKIEIKKAKNYHIFCCDWKRVTKCKQTTSFGGLLAGRIQRWSKEKYWQLFSAKLQFIVGEGGPSVRKEQTDQPLNPCAEKLLVWRYEKTFMEMRGPQNRNVDKTLALLPGITPQTDFSQGMSFGNRV